MQFFIITLFGSSNTKFHRLSRSVYVEVCVCMKYMRSRYQRTQKLIRLHGLRIQDIDTQSGSAYTKVYTQMRYATQEILTHSGLRSPYTYEVCVRQSSYTLLGQGTQEFIRKRNLRTHEIHTVSLSAYKQKFIRKRGICYARNSQCFLGQRTLKFIR